MTTATGPIFLTRGTQAKVDAMPTTRAGRVVSSILDTDPSKRRVYVDDIDGTRRALAWEDDVPATQMAGMSWFDFLAMSKYV
jgi:hypothetical protein